MTHACWACGRNERTASARRPDSRTSCGPRISNGFSCLPSTRRPILSSPTNVRTPDSFVRWASRSITAGCCHARSRYRSVRKIETPRLPLHPVKPQRAVHPLPQIVVFYRHQPPKTLPAPSAGSPFGQTVAKAPAYVIAAANERYARRLVERFQSAHHGEQLEPFATDLRLVVGRLEAIRSVDLPQHEPPVSRLVRPTRFGIEQVVWVWTIHRIYCQGRFGRLGGCVKSANLGKLVESRAVTVRKHGTNYHFQKFLSILSATAP